MAQILFPLSIQTFQGVGDNSIMHPPC